MRRHRVEMKKFVVGLGGAFAACGLWSVEAAVKLGAPFADGMVLQRDRAVPVWGAAEPGEEVTVRFAGQTVSATAGADGKWRLDLRPLAASKESHVLSVTSKPASGVASGAKTIVNDVLVGEVWFASGQSNMECPIWGDNTRYRDGNGAMMIKSTVRPYVRWAKNSRVWSAKPKAIENVKWHPLTPEGFAARRGDYLSACAYYYALELYNALEIPIGIIDSSWGGTNIDAWTPRCGYENHPELRDVAAYPVTDQWKGEMRTGPVIAAPMQPTVIWNGMVDAWTPFAIRGFIWYQGCHNAFEADRYCSKMHALYDGWSKAFGNPDLKLYFVELAPYSMSWYRLQLQQEKFAAEEPNAALAVICDHGNLADIHPNDKEIVAKRLALHALRRDYGFASVRDNSPTLKSWRIENGKFVLSFNDAEEGWYVYADDMSMRPAFEIAGRDGKFVPARLENMDGNGRVKGRDLVVSAAGVAEPQRLRYLEKSPYAGTLYSDAALPLGPLDIDARANRPTRVGAPVKMGDALKIPELKGYREVLSLDFAAAPNFTAKPPPDPKSEKAFKRVAYLLELENADGSVDWVMTAMDAFTNDSVRLGVPYRAGTKIQAKVSNLTVRSNRSNVTSVTEAEGGVIEFWTSSYAQECALADSPGNASTYDMNDSCEASGNVGYGSMQVHNAARGETLWAINAFNNGEVCDLGIGTNDETENGDWTFMHNANAWCARRLTVLVK